MSRLQVLLRTVATGRATAMCWPRHCVLCLGPCVCLSTCLSTCLNTCLSTCLNTCLNTCLPSSGYLSGNSVIWGEVTSPTATQHTCREKATCSVDRMPPSLKSASSSSQMKSRSPCRQPKYIVTSAACHKSKNGDGRRPEPRSRAPMSDRRDVRGRHLKVPSDANHIITTMILYLSCHNRSEVITNTLLYLSCHNRSEGTHRCMLVMPNV